MSSTFFSRASISFRNASASAIDGSRHGDAPNSRASRSFSRNVVRIGWDHVAAAPSGAMRHELVWRGTGARLLRVIWGWYVVAVVPDKPARPLPSKVVRYSFMGAVTHGDPSSENRPPHPVI